MNNDLQQHPADASPALPQPRLSKAVALLRQRIPGLVGIWLFGSAVNGPMREESDVDMAFLADGALPLMEQLKLQGALSNLFDGREVDLLDLNALPTVMRMQVIAKGVRLYCADRSRCEAFEDFVFDDYAQLNEDRAPVLEEVFERGSIRG